MQAALILLLAQTCVAEIDLQASPAECVVMWSVNARTATARGLELAAHTRRFNSYWKVPHTTRAWIGELGTDGAAPAGWPKNRSWSAESPAWRAYLAAATVFVMGPRARVCARADDYGGDPDDGKHADDLKPCREAIRVRCLPGERQAYWNTRPCRRARARRAKGRIRADVAAGRAPGVGGAGRVRRPRVPGP